MYCFRYWASQLSQWNVVFHVKPMLSPWIRKNKKNGKNNEKEKYKTVYFYTTHIGGSSYLKVNDSLRLSDYLSTGNMRLNFLQELVELNDWHPMEIQKFIRLLIPHLLDEVLPKAILNSPLQNGTLPPASHCDGLSHSSPPVSSPPQTENEKHF